MANILPERFQRTRELLGYTQVQMGNKLGITSKYLGMIERGDKDVAEDSSLGLLFRVVEENVKNLTFSLTPKLSGFSDSMVREDPPIYGVREQAREIPVLGWAHTGQAASYEEIPESWQRRLPTDCRDEKAFAVLLEGDSMEPMFREGDIVVLMPGERIHNGCLAVVRLVSDGVLLRRIEMRGERMRLVPLNPRYEADEMGQDEILWAYPVWGRWTPIWKPN